MMLTFVCIAGSAYADTFTITTATGSGADSSIRGSTTTNLGTAALSVRSVVNSTGGSNYKIYLRFDLRNSGLTLSQATSATLNLSSITASTNVGFDYYVLADGRPGDSPTGWLENTLNYSNAPGNPVSKTDTTFITATSGDANGNYFIPLGQLTGQKTGTGAVHSFTSTALLNAVKADSNGVITIGIRRTDTQKNINLTNKENTKGYLLPTLVIVAPKSPTVTTQAATNVSYTNATLNAGVNPNGVSTTAQFSYSTSPTLASGVVTTTAQSMGSGSSPVAATAALTGLLPHTTYYFRASATNAAGTTQGGILSFTTLNHAPVAVNDSIAAPGGSGPFNISVLANDSDADSDTLSITATTNGTYGTVSTNGTSLTYTPDAGYQGNDSFTYTISDGAGGTATASVTLFRAPAVTTQAATGVSFTTATLNGIANPGGMSATAQFSYSTSPTLASGVVTTTVQSLGSGTSDVPATASLTGLLPHTTYYFRVSATSTAGTGTGSILSFTTSNHAPVAVNDLIAAPAGAGAFTINVLANDSDADGDALAFSGTTNGTYGTVSTAGTTLTYTPGGSYQGNDVFTYSVSDGAGGTATASVTIFKAPTVTTQAATNVSYTTVTLNATVNPNGTSSAAQFSYSTSPTLASGVTTTTAQALGGGTSGVATNVSLSGLAPHTTYYFRVSATSSAGTSTGGILSFATLNHTPVVVPDNMAAPAGSGAFQISVLANDSDADSDTLSISATTNGTYGTVSASGTTLTYTPGGSYQGNDTFTYTATDGFGGTAMTSVTISKAPPVTTQAATNVSYTTATLNAGVNPGGVATTGQFSYSTSPTLASGVVTTTAQPLGSGTSAVPLTVGVSGLLPHTTYYFRASATSGAGTTQGGIVSFTTLNHSPVAVNDTFPAPATAGAFSLDVLANDTEADSDSLSISATTNGTYGTVSTLSGVLTYTPGASYQGNDTFTYTVSDGFGATATATVTLFKAPTVTALAASSVSFTTATLNATVNPGGLAATGFFSYSTSPTLASGVTSTSTQSFGSGTSAVAATASLTGLLPHTTYYFRASATSSAGTSTGSVLSFTTSNHVPVAVNDSLAAPASAGVFNISVLTNDSDADGDSLTFSSATNGSYGTVSASGTTLTYTPGASYQGNDTFTYTVTDGFGGTATATVTIFKAPTVATLAASSLSFTTATLNGTVNPGGINAAAQFSYSTSPTLASGVTTTTAQAVGSGTSAVAATASLTGLQPHTTYYFRIAATSSAGTSTGGILSFTTSNHTPVAVNDTMAAPAAAGAFTVPVLANDSDADSDTLSITGTTNGTYGTVTFTATTLTYTPGGSYQGNDSFTYTVSDGFGASATAIVTIFKAPAVTTQAATSVSYTSVTLNARVSPNGISTTGFLTYSTSPTFAFDVNTTTAQALGNGTSAVTMTSALPDLLPHTTYYFRASATNSGGTTQGGILNFTTLNHLPVAVDDIFPAPSLTGDFTLDVLANDDDEDVDDSITITATTNGSFGTVTTDGDQVTYTPGSKFTGNDTFTYTISDDVGGTDTATVTINRAPSATTQAATSVSYTSATLNGSVNPNGISTTGRFSYSTSPTLASGVTTTAQSLGSGTAAVALTTGITGLQAHTTYYFAASATNTGGTTQDAILNFTTSNHAPVVVNDSFAAPAGTSAGTFDVRANDTDADGDTLSVTATTNGTYGTVSTNGVTVTYTPGAGYQGNDTFTYTVSDGFNGTATGTVTLTRAPAATTQAATAVSYTSATLNGSVNPGGIAGTASFSYSTNATLASGVTTTTAQAVGSGITATAVTAPLTGLPPHTTYYFRVNGTNAGGSSTGSILNFTTSNHVPVAVNDTFAAPAGSGAFSLDVKANDTDADNDTLTVTGTTDGTYGTLGTNGSTITYTPGGSYQGNDTFTYTVSDGFGGTATGTVTLTRSPSVVTMVADSVSYTTATLNATANPGGVPATGVFAYSTSATLASGVTTTTAQPLGSGTVAMPMTASLTGLLPHKTYYFRASANNGTGSTNGSILSFTTLNHTPAASDDSFASPAGSGATTFDVRANDSDADGDTLSITTVTNGTYGTVSTNGSTVTYTPGSGSQGNDTFTYTVSDGFGGTATATVTLYRVPSVTSLAATEVSYTSATLNASANPGGIAATGSLRYSTDAMLSTGVTFTTAQPLGSGATATPFSASLAGLLPHTTYYFNASATNSAGTAQGTILSFTTSNHSPVAANDSFAAPAAAGAFILDVKANDSDADGDTLTISAVSNGAYGSVSTNHNTVTYTPGTSYQGNDSFTYTVSDGFGGTATGIVTLYRAATVVTEAASDVLPGSATLNALVTPNGAPATLSFEYSTDPAFAVSTFTNAASVGSGQGSVDGSAAVTGLQSGTRYYFRAMAVSAAGTTQSSTLSFLTPLLAWGGTGAPPATGQLDATVIPNTTTAPVVYPNVNHQGYDVQISTQGLAGNEFMDVLGEPAWWLEGSALGGSGPATVQIRFCATGTLTPRAVTGVHFRFEDAELYEALSNFSYFTADGTEVPLLWNDSAFSYSHTPVFNSSRTEVENGAPPESTVQNGKWIDVNLSGIPVSGFKFGLRRKAVSAAGGLMITNLGGSPSPFNIMGTFSPIAVNTDASGMAVLADYTAQARIAGSTTARLEQTPAPGTRVCPGRATVMLQATDADGNTARTGFNLTVTDRTPPSILPPARGFTPLTVTSPATLLDYTAQAVTSDNFSAVKVTQSPKAGTIASLGLLPVTLTATDAGGNTASTTFTVTVVAEAVGPTDIQYASAVASSGPISGAGESSGPAPSSGASAPSIPVTKGATYYTFGNPSLDDSGSMAFSSVYLQGTLRKSGIFAGSPPKLVVAKGDPVPGVSDAVFNTFSDPVLNRSGSGPSIAFQATMLAAAGKPAIPATTNTGIWTNVGGSVVLLARTGSAAPEANGGTFKTINGITCVEDEVLIAAALTLNTGDVTTATDQGVWRWTPATGLHLLLREGQTLPGTSDNKVVSSFQMIGTVASSTGHGRHHLAAGLYEARVLCTDKAVVNYLIDATSGTAIYLPLAQTGQALIPDLTATTVGVPAGNAAGETAFVETFAVTKSKSVTAANNLGIVSNRGGVWSTVVTKGKVACDSATWLGFTDPVINAGGDVAWISALAGCPATLNSVIGWSPKGQSPVIAARKGGAAPGTSGGVFATFTSVALPDDAGPLFTASLLRGTGDTTANNDTGLWGMDSSDSLRLLLRRGQVIAGRTVRTFVALTSIPGSPGQTHSFNGQHAVLVSVTFTDNVQSLLTIMVP